MQKDRKSSQHNRKRTIQFFLLVAENLILYSLQVRTIVLKTEPNQPVQPGTNA